jgi:hypothetical protein
MQPKFAPELVPAIEEYRCDNGRVQIVTSGQETEKLQ